MKNKITMWNLHTDKDKYAFGFLDNYIIIVDKSDPSSHIKLSIAMCRWIGRRGIDKLIDHIKHADHPTET